MHAYAYMGARKLRYTEGPGEVKKACGCNAVFRKNQNSPFAPKQPKNRITWVDFRFWHFLPRTGNPPPSRIGFFYLPQNNNAVPLKNFFVQFFLKPIFLPFPQAINASPLTNYCRIREKLLNMDLAPLDHPLIYLHKSKHKKVFRSPELHQLPKRELS